MNLVVNSLLRREDNGGKVEDFRVLWINPGGSEVVLLNLSDPVALPFWTTSEVLLGEAKVNGLSLVSPENDEYLVKGFVQRKSITVEQRTDAIWNIIKPLVENEDGTARLEIFIDKTRGPLIEAAYRQHKRAKRLIYDYLRRYWRGGQIKTALTPNYANCGVPGDKRNYTKRPGRPSAIARATGESQGIILREEHKRLFRRGLSKYFENKQKMPLTETFNRILGGYFYRDHEVKEGILIPIMPPANELPTFKQFENWYYGQQDVERTSRKRNGDRGFELKNRQLLGSGTSNVPGPGFLAQIDATVGDIYLVSSLDPLRIIGRPVVYFVIDVFSRMIMGLSVSLEGPSWLGAMLAIENVCADKVEFCAEYGINIEAEEWPCQALFRSLLGDRGELEGRNATAVVESLGIRISNTPPYRADWKSIVERYFRLSNDRVTNWLPGAVYHHRERGDRDYRLDAVLNLREFRKLMILLALYHNNLNRVTAYEYKEFMVESKIPPYPIDLWNWGIENRTGYLKQLPLDIVRSCLLPKSEASVTPSGILFRKRYFVCDKALAENWFVQARAKGVWRVTVSYDPRKPKILYLHDPDNGTLLPCRILPKSEDEFGCDWDEIRDYEELQLQARERARSPEIQGNVDFQARVDSIVEKAVERAEGLADQRSQLSKTQLLGNIRQNRQEEQLRDRQETGWLLEGEAEVQRQGTEGITPITPDPKPSGS